MVLLMGGEINIEDEKGGGQRWREIRRGKEREKQMEMKK